MAYILPFVLGVVLRSLVATKDVVERRWTDVCPHSQHVAHAPPNTRGSGDGSGWANNGSDSIKPDEDSFVMQPQFKLAPKTGVNYGTRAAVDTMIAGVSFLIVLFVMPKDTGYVLSFLAGIFIGSLAVGRRAD